MKSKTPISNYLLLILFFVLMSCSREGCNNVQDLNGEWSFGVDRKYSGVSDVPGLAISGDSIIDGRLWFKRNVILPDGDWTTATLSLKGARFNPDVYVNGKLVGSKKGGMAPLSFKLNHKDIKPGNTVLLEIALMSLKDVRPENASFIPVADHWRSNVSSCLWDNVEIHFHKKLFISRYFPVTYYDKDKLVIKYELGGLKDIKEEYSISAELVDNKGNSLVIASKESQVLADSISVDMRGKIESWSPDSPNLYTLKLILKKDKIFQDCVSCNYGKKQFEVKDKKFYLNNKQVTARGASVVWHRWIRNKEGEKLGWDYDWFEKNIILRLKDLGANTIRFHLGTPPEKILDLCDKHGLLVQYEWIFFHGMTASESSLNEQWPVWFDLGMKHPSVSIYHPYNETYGDQLQTAWNALNNIVPQYQKIALEDRDILHLHKYWWSLFENVGVYYENAEQFPKAIMVDEYGGNYLDGDYNLGGYTTLPQSFLRFLGRGHTKEMRKAHHTLSSSKISEYWRQLGAAGYAPFCALGSYEDGNHWFEGDLKEGKPKPVWAGLASSYSPISVTMNLWDRNFSPRQEKEVELYLYNETEEKRDLQVEISILKDHKSVFSKTDSFVLTANETKVERQIIKIPQEIGSYVLQAKLLNTPENVKAEVISSWEIHVIEPTPSDVIKDVIIGVEEDDKELRTFLQKMSIQTVSPDNEKAQMFIGSRAAWNKLVDGENNQLLTYYIDKGKNVVLLDVGDLFLGQGYIDFNETLRSLQGSPVVNEPVVSTYNLIKGVTLTSTQVAEPESHIHPSLKDSSLWCNLQYDANWLWNGYKGGLIVPSVDMSVNGLSQNAFLSKWKAKGANISKIKNESYFAYELQGYYRFSNKKEDEVLKKELRSYVHFIVEDAPALAGAINPNASIQEYNLHQQYLDSKNREATNLIPLVNAGKDLLRIPVVKISFGDSDGQLILSQLLTQGRLISGNVTSNSDPKVDAVAQQVVLNMISNLEK